MLTRDELFDLYKIAIDEYRFEVDLNWQRTKYFCVLNAAIIAIATGLIKIGEPENNISIFISMIFFVGIITSRLGIVSIRQGEIYYHRTIHKKTLIERELGLFDIKSSHEKTPIDLTISTTPGMDKRDDILEQPAEYLKRGHFKRIGTIKYNISLVLYSLLIINVFGCLYSLKHYLLIAFKYFLCQFC